MSARPGPARAARVAVALVAAFAPVPEAAAAERPTASSPAAVEQAAAWEAVEADEAGERSLPESARWIAKMTGEDGPFRALDVAPDGAIVLGGPDALVLLGPGGEPRSELRMSVDTFSAAAEGVVWAVRRPRGLRSRVVRWTPDAARLEAWAPPDADPGSVEPRVDAVFGIGPASALVAVEGSLYRVRVAPADGGTVLRATPVTTGVPRGRAAGVPPGNRRGQFLHLGGCRRFSGPVVAFVVVRQCVATRIDARFGETRAVGLLPAVDDAALLDDGGIAAVSDEELSIVAADGTVERRALPPGVEADPLLVAARDASGIRLVGQTSRRTWRLRDGGWEASDPVPLAVGRPVDVATAGSGGDVYVLGVNGVAIVGDGDPARVLHRTSAVESVPAASLVVPLLVLATALLVLVGGAVLVLLRRGADHERWSLLDAAIAIGLFTMGQLFGAALWFALGSGLSAGPASELPTEAIAMSFVAGGLFAGGWILRCLNRRRLPLSSIGWDWSRAGRDALLGAALVVPAYVAVFAVAFAAELVGLPAFLYTQEQTTSLAGRTGAVSVVSLVLLAVLFAPLFEEVVFRGLLLRTLAERFGPATALAVTSLVFGLAHVEGILTTLTLGLFFAGIVLRTGRLPAAIFAHALTNGTSLVLLFSGLAS